MLCGVRSRVTIVLITLLRALLVLVRTTHEGVSLDEKPSNSGGGGGGAGGTCFQNGGIPT